MGIAEEQACAMLKWAILQDKKPIAIRVPSNGVNHTSDAVDTEYSYESKYKVMHEGSEVAIIAAGSFYQKGEHVLYFFRLRLSMKCCFIYSLIDITY